MVQDRVQDKVQDKVGLRKLSLKNFFLQKALKCHVWWRNCEKKFPFKNILDLENIWSKKESKTKLDLKNFHPKIFFAKSLKMSCLVEKL